MTDSKNPAYEAYKEFIDALVDNALNGGGGPRLEKSGKVFAPLDEDVTPYRDFVASLTESQRQLLVNLLRKERCDAFHDLLAELTWRIDCRGFGMTFNGNPMRVGIEGGLHNDFVGRSAKDYVWEWPENP
jgi:hypothetical protein